MSDRDPQRAADYDRELRQDHYTPEELADLLEMDVYVVRSAVWDKQLPATIMGNTIVSIRREDVLNWLARRG
ncbi:MAG TPA: helix-turn-helix domain-containing protein [Thermomicrobiaceae bacterium]|nr:helix-turn-helix domain-containing protein [Thermomicrobiaceae bacterium]